MKDWIKSTAVKAWDRIRNCPYATGIGFGAGVIVTKIFWS